MTSPKERALFHRNKRRLGPVGVVSLIRAPSWSAPQEHERTWRSALQQDRLEAELLDGRLASYYSPGLMRPPLSTVTSMVSIPLLALVCQTPVLSRERSTTSV
jgi:hypothetical protein